MSAKRLVLECDEDLPQLLSAGAPDGDGAVRGPDDVDPESKPAFPGGKAEGQATLEARAEQLADLQELLFANGTSDQGSGRSVLLVVQAMDTAGKGGILRHVVGAMDPQGVHTVAFKKPTEQELEHDFLWRIRPHLPRPGFLSVFDRSHYEDVLVHRVRELTPLPEIEERYAAIRAFEREVVESGTAVIKVMLHLSPQEQKERLTERLERPEKHWKFNPGDIDERLLWDGYMDAYRIAIEQTHTEQAPWFIVPANRKWYSRLAVQELLIQTLEGMDLQWPQADFDVEAQKRRLAQS